MRVLLVFVLVRKTNRRKVPINNSCLRSIFVEYLVSPLYCDVSFQWREILLGNFLDPVVSSSMFHIKYVYSPATLYFIKKYFRLYFFMNCIDET